jgi:hypothetical protein
MSKKWAQHNWKGCLDALGIVRRRPFYNCRHTVITELVKAGHNLKAIADYVGTSVAMIEANYCARQGLNLAQNSHSSQPNYLENMVAGPGFEPVPPAASKNLQVLKMNDFKGFRKRKSA